jgi:hypothetical protein
MLRFTFNWLKEQVGPGGLIMTCKKDFFTMNHAKKSRDKRFYLKKYTICFITSFLKISTGQQEILFTNMEIKNSSGC